MCVSLRREVEIRRQPGVRLRQAMLQQYVDGLLDVGRLGESPQGAALGLGHGPVNLDFGQLVDRLGQVLPRPAIQQPRSAPCVDLPLNVQSDLATILR